MIKAQRCDMIARGLRSHSCISSAAEIIAPIRCRPLARTLSVFLPCSRRRVAINTYQNHVVHHSYSMRQSVGRSNRISEPHARNPQVHYKAPYASTTSIAHQMNCQRLCHSSWIAQLGSFFRQCICDRIVIPRNMPEADSHILFGFLGCKSSI